MKQYNNNYIILILLLFFFSSCIFEKYEDVRDDVNGYISLNITPMSVVQTKGTMYREELLIKDAYLLLFDKDGKYFEGEALDISLISGNGTTTPKIKTFTPADKYESIILINTGCNYGADNIPLAKGVSTKEDINKYFTAETWHLNPLSGDFAVPMSGTISGTDTCQIRAAVAKATLTFFKPGGSHTIGQALSQTICNFPKYGNIYQDNINNPFDTFDYSKIIDKQKAGRTINNPAYYSTHYEYAFYIPEFPNAEYDYSGTKIDNKKYSNKRLCIVFLNESSNKYYRVDFYDRKNGEFIDIQRNKHYQIYIDRITSDGYNTFEEALNNTDGINAISYYIETPFSYDVTEYEKYSQLRKKVYVVNNGDYAIITNYKATFVSSKKQEQKKFLLSCMLTTPKSGKPKPDYKFELMYREYNSSTRQYVFKNPVPSDILKMDIKKNVPLIATDNPEGLQTGFYKAANDTILTEKDYFDIYCTVLKDLDETKEIFLKISYGDISTNIHVGQAKFFITPKNVTIPAEGGEVEITVNSFGKIYEYDQGDGYNRFIGFEQIGKKNIGIENFDVKYKYPQSEIPYFEGYYGYNDGTFAYYASLMVYKPLLKVSSTSKNYNLSPHIVVEPYSKSTRALRDAEDINKLSGMTRYNLSNQTNGGDGIENTANCYVINNPGKYRLPLVYGNAIKNGADNKGAYSTPNIGNNILSQFVNSINAPIIQPYIYGQQNPHDCCLVWQDMYMLVDSIRISEDKRWLEFTIPTYNLCDGNAVVAVRDASGNILWSWHIWVTGYKLGTDLKKLKERFPVGNGSPSEGYTTGRTYEVMPVNLGEIEPYAYTTGGDSKCVMYFKQAITGLVDSVIVVRKGGGGSTVQSQQGGIGYTFYSYGRKDPLHPRAGRFRYIDQSLKDEDTSTIYYERNHAKSASIGYTISHPYIRFCIGVTSPWIGRPMYVNLWGSNYTDYGRGPIDRLSIGEEYYKQNIKTVYDPCPPGYKIAPGNTFTGCTPTGKNFFDMGNYDKTDPIKVGKNQERIKHSSGWAVNDRVTQGFPLDGSADYIAFKCGENDEDLIYFPNVTLRLYNAYSPNGQYLYSIRYRHPTNLPTGAQEFFYGQGGSSWLAPMHNESQAPTFRVSTGDYYWYSVVNGKIEFWPFIMPHGIDDVGSGQGTYTYAKLGGINTYNTRGVRPVKED